MRVFCFMVVSFFLLNSSLTSCRSKQTVVNEVSQNAELRNLIISYDGKNALSVLKKEINTYGASIIYEYNNFNSVAISIPKEKSIDDAIKHFEKIKGVLGVQKDEMMQLQN